MKRKLTVLLIITFITILTLEAGTKYISSNKKSSLSLSQDPYEKICAVFVGRPKKDVVKPLLEAVMKKYKLPVTEENIMKAASVVLTLRKKSSIGITEIQILKHMYQQGTQNSTFTNQAALSSVILEKVK